MTPDLIFFGIKALIRLGRQGDRALIEYAADQPLEFPDVKTIKRDRQAAIEAVLALPRYAALRESFGTLWTAKHGGHIDNSEWIKLSEEGRVDKIAKVIDAARGDSAGLALLNEDDERSKPAEADNLTGIIVVEQWKPDRKPVSPLGRMALTIVEVALDYVTVDPGVLRAGDTGEKVIKSFAIALGGPLSAKLDAATLGPRAQMTNTLLAAFVSAGLGTLKAHTGDLISELHLAKLVENVLAPVIDDMKNVDAITGLRFQRILDVLAVPVANAAIRTVAENPAAFLGSKFDSSKAAGALVGSILIAAAKDGNVQAIFTEQGLLRLVSASLGVVAEKPGLFIKIGDDKDEAATLAVDLAGLFATKLRDGVNALASDKVIDGRALGAGIAAAVVEALARHVGALGLSAEDPWGEVGTKIAKDVLDSLVEAIKSQNGTAFKQVLSEEKMVELGRIVVEGIAANRKLVGVENSKAREVVGAVATAIGKFAETKKQFVLDADGWLDLARLMTKELVARVPALTAGADPRLQYVASALGTIIEGDKNSVLSGDDVVEIARALLTELAGHPQVFEGLNEDIKNVALAFAQSMAADKNLLLSASDWVEVLKAAAAEASANPDRLFGPEHNTGASLAGDISSLVVGTLGKIIEKHEALSGLVVKSQFVREATITILQAVSGAPDLAKTYQSLLKAAVEEASEFVAKNAGRYGGSDWLRLIKVLVTAIVHEKYDAASIGHLIQTPEVADALLAGGA